MNLKKVIILVTSIIGFVFADCQNIYIDIKGENIRNKNVRLTYISDRISLMEKPLANKYLDSNTSSVSFSATLDETKEMIVKIDMREYHFLAKPGNKYFLDIEPFNDSVFKFDYKEILPCKLGMQHYDSINTPINDVDTVFDDFLRDNSRMLYVKDSSAKDSLYSIERYLLEKYKDNDYMLNYIKYEFAGIKYGFSLESKKKIKDSLFANSPILYDNIGYMDCLNTIFAHYFTRGYKFIKRIDIENWLDDGNYNAFNDALGRDKVLSNEVFRELVFLLGMKDAYLEGYFNRKRILSMIKNFENLTKFQQHKNIAKNLVEYLISRDFSGKKIADYKLKDIKGDDVMISSFADKPLIICFVKLDSTPSLKELETIHYFYDSIKNNCNILTVCCDNNYEKMYNFVRNNKVGNKYKWPFVYFNYNWEMTEAYQLHFFPTFVLVNQDGTIGQNPMASPSENGLKQFFNKKK